MKKYKVLFVVFSVIYFIVGFFHITNYSLTIDEPAHLGAADSYRLGKGVNIEHPPLNKTINSLLIKYVFPNYQVIATDQYQKGIEFLVNSPYNPNHVLNLSRTTYLIFNYLLIIWLAYYTFVLKLFDPKFSTIFAALYIFSPSFSSLNPLLIFDVPGAITILMAIVSITYLYYSLESNSFKKLLPQIVTVSILTPTAILTKHTNVIIAAIGPLIILLSLIPHIIHKKFTKKLFQKYLAITTLISTISLFLIYLTYHYAYRYIPFEFTRNTPQFLNKSILIPLHRAIEHPLWIYDYVQTITKPNFVDDSFVYITYHQFINRVFWFKENPVLLLIILVSLIFIIVTTAKNYKKFSRIRSTTINNLNKILVAISISIFPIYYFFSAKDKEFTIGYRHFLVISIFIYFGLAAVYYFIYQTQYKVFTKAATISLALYLIFGFFAFPKGLNYTNFLWTKPKYTLANDSTVYLAEYQRKPMEYLREKGLLPDKNDKNVTFIIRGHKATQEFQLQFITGEKNPNFGTYNIGIDPMNELIEESEYKHLIVDIFWFQNILDESKNNPIAEQNWNYLTNNEPIWSYNESIFIYQLN